jgi:acetylornithine deacetylase
VSVQRCATLLGELIAYRTPNPGGDEVALCSRLADELRTRGCDRADVVEVPREGSRGGYVFGTFGEPRLIINVHVDTVPANTGWSRDPWAAEITAERVTGLGSADTKGAIAAALTAIERVRPTNVGFLFSGDEEHGTTCIEAFLASEHARGIERAIVCEPTSRTAGIRHRGVGAYRAGIEGRGGHSSNADRMPKPVVAMARLAVALDQLGRDYLDRGPQDMRGLCLNVASLDGGVAFNVVPDRASLTWSVRPPPGFDEASFDGELAALIRGVDPAITLELEIDHAPFATRDQAWFEQRLGGQVATFGPLQFWTEAAMLSSAGIDAVVVGPGDIGHAHAADEFVTLADLDWAIELFAHVFETDGAAP